MGVFLIILVAAAAFGGYLFLNYKKKVELLKSGKIIDRDSEFLKQIQYFTTKTESMKEISDTIDKESLQEEGLSVLYNKETNVIVFRVDRANNSFVSIFCLLSRQSDGRFQYRYQIETWSGREGGMSQKDILSANMALTAIEKALLKLDNKTDIKSLRAN